MTETDIDRLTKEIKDLRIRVAQLESQRPSDDTSILQVGDRVRIKNKIRKPKHWPTEKAWTETLERKAIVTRVTTDRIYITTDNGTLTWRQPSNIKKDKDKQHD
jgi:hypothetical protein